MEKLQICLSDYSKFLKTKSGQDFLAELSKSKDYAILTQVANCEQMSSKMLMELKRHLVTMPNEKLDGTYKVLMCIANNPSLDADGLDAICDYCIDSKVLLINSVKYISMLNEILVAIAANKNTCEKTFKKLSTQAEPVISKMVKNPSLSDQMLISIVETTRLDIIKAAAAAELARRLKEKISPKESN